MFYTFWEGEERRGERSDDTEEMLGVCLLAV